MDDPAKQRSEAGKRRQAQVEQLLQGDLDIARATLREELAKVREALEPHRPQAETDYGFIELIGASFDEELPSTDAVDAADILETEAYVLSMGLARVVLQLDPPYLRETFPPELIDLLQDFSGLYKGNLLALKDDARFCIGMYDETVALTCGSDDVGLAHSFVITPEISEQLQAIGVLITQIHEEWNRHQQQELRKNRVLPPDELIRDRLQSVSIHFERASVGIRTVVTDCEGLQTIVEHLRDHDNGLWDGRRSPTNLGNEFYSSLAYDVLVAVGFDGGSAHVLAKGGETGASFGAVMAELDGELQKGRSVDISGIRLAEWINQCDPCIRFGADEFLRLQIEPLPAISVAELAVPGRGIA